MRITIFASFLFLISVRIYGQTPATTHDSILFKFQHLEKKLDSLESVVKDARARMVTHSDFEGILRSINEDDKEFTDEDRRSKRRALDSLFRSAVSKPGQLTFTGQFMNVFHWDGRFDNSTNSVVGTVDLFAISSFGKNSLVFINLQGVGGDGPGKSFPTLSGYHAGAGSTQSTNGLDYINILEAWVEYRIGKANITLGKIDLTNYFDPNSVANDEYSQFLANGFVNSLAFSTPGNSPGITFNTTFFKDFNVQFGIASKDNSGDQIFNNLFTIMQIGKVFRIKNDEVGALRAYAYKDPDFNNGWGYGFSADARLSKRIYTYIRYGQNQDSLARNFGIHNALSGGFQLRNYALFKASNLSSGIALGRVETIAIEGESVKEEMFEAYVRFNIKKVFFLSPHFQHFWNVNGLKNQHNSFIGLRTRVAF